MHGETIIDATIINAPSSIKNVEKKRDSKMHQTEKGNEWKFGIKCNIEVDVGYPPTNPPTRHRIKNMVK